MPRILFLQHTSICDQYGGIEYYLNDLLDLAAKTQGEENILTLISSKNGEKKLSYPANFVKRSSHPLLRKLQNRFDPWFYKNATKNIQAFSPDILVSSHVSFGPLAHLLSKRYSLPYWTIVYGIDCWGDLWPQDEWSLRRADGIISISHWTKRILVDRGLEAKKVKILQPRLPPTFERISLPIRKETDTLTLLTVSRLDSAERYKGQDHVMLALAHLKKQEPLLKFKYVIQGEGTDLVRLKALCVSLDLQEKMEFIGKMPDREGLKDLYRKADLYVMPSRFGKWDGSWKGEGFGIVYLEAAAFGLPSIAYDCGGATDIIKNEQNGLLIEPDNIEALAGALARMNRNRPLLRQMGTKAKQMTEKGFTESPIRKQWEQILLTFPSGVSERGQSSYAAHISR